jgi:hypothetical protein
MYCYYEYVIVLDKFHRRSYAVRRSSKPAGLYRDQELHWMVAKRGISGSISKGVIALDRMGLSGMTLGMSLCPSRLPHRDQPSALPGARAVGQDLGVKVLAKVEEGFK